MNRFATLAALLAVTVLAISNTTFAGGCHHGHCYKGYGHGYGYGGYYRGYGHGRFLPVQKKVIVSKPIGVVEGGPVSGGPVVGGSVQGTPAVPPAGGPQVQGTPAVPPASGPQAGPPATPPAGGPQAAPPAAPPAGGPPAAPPAGGPDAPPPAGGPSAQGTPAPALSAEVPPVGPAAAGPAPAVNPELLPLMGLWETVTVDETGRENTLRVNLEPTGDATVTVDAAGIGPVTLKRKFAVQDGNFNLIDGQDTLTLGKVISANKDQVVMERDGAQLTFVRPEAVQN